MTEHKQITNRFMKALIDKPEQPTKSSSATKENLTPIIEPKTKVENSEVAGQPLEQPNSKDGIHVPIFVPNNLIKHLPCPEQPNTELLIVKTIQGLTSAVSRELGVLDEETQMLSCHRNSLVLQALEDIDSFEKTTLFELQKAFE